MKLLTHSISKRLRTVHLYREDLLELERIFKDDLKHDSIKVATNNYEYDSIDEIPIDSPQSHEFVISASSPFTQVTLSKSGGDIYFSEDTVLAKGGLADIMDFFQKRQTNIKYYFIKYVMFSPALSLVLLILDNPTKSHRIRLVFFSIMMSVVIMLPFGYYLSSFRYSTIDFDKRSIKPNFFTRNRDALIVNAIFLILGTLMGILLAK